jgi:NAD(P)-dependent dehydrogenase (short-subunit alcohol dehydrogenase family)
MKPRSVIITGGGTGIGRATARRFAAEGDQVLVVGRTAETLAETANGHDNIRTLVTDLTHPDAAGSVVAAAVAAFGGVDILVNNAAVAVFAPLEKLDRDSVEEQIRVNLLAPTMLAQAALDPLEASGGTIVNVSSAGSLGIRAFPENAVYWATKSALNSLTRAWAMELAGRGIRVLSVAPGVVDTGIGERMGWPAEAYQAFLKETATKIPAGRVGDPADIAWWIHTVTRPEAGYATGSIVPVDGGLSLT